MHPMKVTKYVKLAALAVPVLLTSCRGQVTTKSPVHLNMNMDQQSRFEAQERNPFFEDNRVMRMPVEGTVARGNLKANDVFYRGINRDSSFVSEIPVELTKAFIRRGQNQYNIYCTPCHGILGDGQGIIMTGQYGYVPAPTFHSDRIRNMPDGEIYSAIANGVRNMPPYGHQVDVEDRWAIVAYVRALQMSQNVPEEDVEQYNINLETIRQEYILRQEEEAAQQQAQGGGAGEEVSAERGQQISNANACNTCHSTDGSELTGPTWQGLFGHEVTLEDGSTVVANEEYIIESIVNPQAKIVEGYQPVMPPYDYLSDSEIQSLVEYIKSLSDENEQ
jgi:mono/diheme cytochrome c family protein